MELNSLIETKPSPNIPPFGPGDTVRVSIKVKEGDRERLQPLQGTVIRVRKRGANANFTIRRVTYGIGVEHTLFFHSPLIEKVEVLQQGKVRRAKLYYLRGLSSKESRAKIKAKARMQLKPKG